MKVLFVFGTRPEAIKLAPLVLATERSGKLRAEVCVTAQHREMLDQVLRFFDVTPQHDLNLMQPNQTLFDITARSLVGLRAVIAESKPDLVCVQGDTTSTFCGALAAYYSRVPVAHLEAGLRSGNRFSPYPEEANRILTGHIADYHFPPTIKAKQNLAAEGITDNVWVVGNTVVDALLTGLSLIKERGERPFIEAFPFLDFQRRIMLVTGHRRESFGGPFEQIAHALREIAEAFPDLQIVYPVHLNPNVREPVNRILGDQAGVHLIEPLDYPELIWLMNRSHIVLTDSGGIQEEAPSLGKPVLVMREVTERTEGIEAKTAKLVGTDREKIVFEAGRLLSDEAAYREMAQAVNPYGDGTTSQQVVEILAQQLAQR